MRVLQIARPVCLEHRYPWLHTMLRQLSRLIIFLPLAIGGCGQKQATDAPPAAKNVLVMKVQAMDVPVQLHEFGRLSSPRDRRLRREIYFLSLTRVRFKQTWSCRRAN